MFWVIGWASWHSGGGEVGSRLVAACLYAPTKNGAATGRQGPLRLFILFAANLDVRRLWRENTGSTATRWT